MRTITSTKNQVILPQLENNKKDFIKNKTFFKNLQYANQASVNSPTLVKQPTEQIKKTPRENFVSSLDIGSLLPNTQPTHKTFYPKHKTIFETQKNKNIDIRSIDFKTSLDFFKNMPSSQDQSLVSRYPRIFKNSRKIEKNFTPVEDHSITHKTQEDLPMQTSKKNNVETSTFVDFHLNRSAGTLSNFKYKIKSIHEKSIRKFRDVFKTNKKEELCVKFENGEAKITDKATIARQELMKQHKEINHTEKENSAIDLEWDYFEQEPTYLDNRSAVFPHQKNESLNFESNNTDEFNDLITVLYSSDESLNSSGYHSDTSLPLRSSEYSSTESLHQENDNLNPNIDLIINNPTKYYNLTNFNSNNESLKYSSNESLHQKKYNKENFSDINKSPQKQTQTEKMKLLTEGKSSTGYIHPSRREESNSNKI